MGTNIKIFENKEVESTNDWAAEVVKNNLVSGSFAVITEFQTKGKGRQSNTWQSEAGKNLLFSLVFYPDHIKAEDQFVISKIVSLAIQDTISLLCPQTTIKWPNDIYIGDKKVAGILIDNEIKGNFIESTIIGVGININQDTFDESLPNPTSLLLETGSSNSPKVIFNEILNKIINGFDSEHDEIDNQYLDALYRFGETLQFEDKHSRFNGKISGITKYGQLQIETDHDMRVYNFNEIKFVL